MGGGPHPAGGADNLALTLEVAQVGAHRGLGLPEDPFGPVRRAAVGLFPVAQRGDPGPEPRELGLEEPELLLDLGDELRLLLYALLDRRPLCGMAKADGAELCVPCHRYPGRTLPAGRPLRLGHRGPYPTELMTEAQTDIPPP